MRQMADFGRGIKAGLAAAGVYLVISLILAAIGRELWYPFNFAYAAGLGISSGLMDSPLVVYSLLSYMVRGIVFGAVFAALYNLLPGTASIVKGVVLSSFLWIVALIQIVYTTPGWPWTPNGFSGSGTYYSGSFSLSSVGLGLVGIVSAVAFGAFAGFIWNRLRARQVTEARKGSATLLVSFVQGGVLWALGAVPFLIGVVILGGSAIDPDFWWYTVLYTSVVFIGLPGWLLVLFGWRRTRRGETGFRWGMAGGIIMALTGQMLLPGVLAIIGGVLSGRNRATEPSTAEIAH
jgi:hypothetical protein